jgi:hypothetical protein
MMETVQARPEDLASLRQLIADAALLGARDGAEVTAVGGLVAIEFDSPLEK